MQFQGFDQQDFDTFYIAGLNERMSAIQERIQPKFKLIGEDLTMHLAAQLGTEMFLHIAKHARRTVNPPKDTWLAIANNKRGYKQHPHFQVGLFDDHLFIWLAFIYELPNKAHMAQNFIDHLPSVQQAIPKDFAISLDHTKKESTSMEDIDLSAALTRFRDVKKAEFLVGKHIQRDKRIIHDGPQLLTEIKHTFDTLLPLYHLAYE